MNVAVRKPWTTEQFLVWAATQEERYEFDGLAPVAMTGGTARHNRITLNIHAALRPRLRGTPCSSFGPDLGVQTVGNTIRFPDALITCSRFPGSDRLVLNPVVVFEVLSADSGKRDRIDKTREYHAVPSILRYVIVESAGAGVLVLHRRHADEGWSALPQREQDVLALPEVGVEVAIAEFYEDVDFAAEGAGV